MMVKHTFGMTCNLERRIAEHKTSKNIKGHTFQVEVLYETDNKQEARNKERSACYQNNPKLNDSYDGQRRMKIGYRCDNTALEREVIGNCLKEALKNLIE